ncbi:MAG TPA: alpha/beta hydrolase [Pyrinomonadaceae bacterium]|nr:alpha/beta hydrolase [Pyrinomonadaceae bacterium]
MKTTVPTLVRLVMMLACLASGHAVMGQTSQDRFINSNGVRIRYQTWGQGPPVILIHGFGESLESWQRGGVVRSLSPHFQVIALDMRGQGRSDKPHDPKSYGTELSGDIVRVLRHLGIPKAHIVGYSMGALVALDFAVLHQEHTLSVVLGGAGLNPPSTLDDFRQQAEAFEQGKVPGREGDDPKALAALLRGLRVLSEEDVRRIHVPMAVLIGANDRFMPSVQRLSRILPATQVTVIPDVDHATAPSHRKFTQALLAFLLKQKPATR